MADSFQSQEGRSRQTFIKWRRGMNLSRIYTLEVVSAYPLTALIWLYNFCIRCICSLSRSVPPAPVHYGNLLREQLHRAGMVHGAPCWLKHLTNYTGNFDSLFHTFSAQSVFYGLSEYFMKRKQTHSRRLKINRCKSVAALREKRIHYCEKKLFFYLIKKI